MAQPSHCPLSEARATAWVFVYLHPRQEGCGSQMLRVLSRVDLGSANLITFDGLQGRLRPRQPEGSVDLRRQLTAIVEREGDGYVALCPGVDVASQGDSVAEARENLQEAIALFFETASPAEIERCWSDEVYVIHVEVAVG